ncbi:MAG: transporter substrate-binding domain-containing protein [Bacteroides sp.]|nr:transporter substrate-binding domain-containing protein [Bacteroides sp.]
MTNKYIRYIILVFIASLVATFILNKETSEEELIPVTTRDYQEIDQEKVLRVVTEYNSVSYFIEGDTVAGFNYDLLMHFTADKGWKIEITPEMSIEKRLEGLLSGKYDIIASNIPVTSPLRDSLSLTEPVLLNRQILIQRKNETSEEGVIRSHLDLAGKTLYVVKHSHAILRIENLADEIGESIRIEEVEKYGPEQLLAMVAHGDIDYAVCDEAIALAAAPQYPQLDMETSISFTQFYSWGLPKESVALLDTINRWIYQFKIEPVYRELINKYTR